VGACFVNEHILIGLDQVDFDIWQVNLDKVTFRCLIAKFIGEQ